MPLDNWRRRRRQPPPGRPSSAPHTLPSALLPAPQAGDAVPDVKLDELVGGEIKQQSLKELFAGKKVGPQNQPLCAAHNF